MAEAGILQHRAEQAAAALPPLLVAANRVAATVAQGVHGRRRVGQGETFWQFRQYQPGDAATRIDWRESAKSQRLYVRETEWEAAQSAWLWRDASPSMDYASTRDLPTKRARADLITLALAALLLRGGERVTLLGTGVAPSHGRAVLMRMAQQLQRAAPGENRGAGLPGIEPLPRHGQLVLMGDLLAPLAETEKLVASYSAMGLKGYLLQVLDPAEETLPFDGRVRFESMENEDPLLISRVETIREQYIERLARHRAGLAAIARAAGWRFATHRTDKPPHTALLTLYMALAAEPGTDL
ncbi:MAG TPA: DUF58 domain-containing protein [Stellaceae bacterium]|jgi:uncharacterized protein (DUF58 family)|nr:DUF58 domain-containing protein [Stellaceae bacterium]